MYFQDFQPLGCTLHHARLGGADHHRAHHAEPVQHGLRLYHPEGSPCSAAFSLELCNYAVRYSCKQAECAADGMAEASAEPRCDAMPVPQDRI